MMGQLPEQQNELFYDFCLEKHIPDGHLLRQIDQFLDFEQIRLHLTSFYSHTGRPSIDPELMIRMLLVGYCYGIRSERRLCEEIHFNLAYRWFCRIGLEEEVPDHSTFSKNRHGRFRDADLLRMAFDTVVQRCSEQGLIKGEGFATDASYIRADASKQRLVAGPVDWRPSPTQTRPVKEYLDVLDEDPAARRTQKKVSLTDPMAQWAGDKGPRQFYYSTNYLIDIEHNVILDIEPTPAYRIAEVNSTKIMLERVEERFAYKPSRLIGDTAYGSASMLEWLVEDKGMAPHIPVMDKSAGKPELFGRSNFTWEADNDRYRCPGGNYLQRFWRHYTKPRTGITKANTIIYKSTKCHCDRCELKSVCCPNVPHRKIARSIYETSRDVARDISKTVEYQQSCNDRKKVEVLFAHLKRILNFDRLRLRGITGAGDEFLMAATIQNLKKLAQLRFKPPDNRIIAPA